MPVVGFFEFVGFEWRAFYHLYIFREPTSSSNGLISVDILVCTPEFDGTL